MVQKSPPHVKPYLADFAALERNGFSHEPTWVQDLRREAIARFGELGFPTSRRGNEEWKYTDIGPIAKATFHVRMEAPSSVLTRSEVEAHAFAGAQRNRLVFVDGRYAPEHSSVEALPQGTFLGRLEEAFISHSHLIAQHLGKHADFQANAFTALNTAFVQDGMFLHVAPGTTLPGPIQVLFLSTRSDSGSVVHPRLLVLMGQDAQAHLIETHASLNEGPYFTNVVTEVVLGRGAKLEHSRLQAESPHAYHVASTHVLQQANSTYTSLAIDTGGGLVRNNLIVVLNEQEAHADMNGLYLLKGEQHVDYNTFIDHAVPHTSAKELYKGILDGHAHAIFGGKVLVRNGAFGTESRQINKTLLLSQGAAIDTKPQLEIYADDVKCAHGAAVGQLDTEALFYLKSRGLGDTEARALLTYGFVSEVLHSVSHIPFRAYLDQMVHAQMQRSNELDQ